MNTSASPTNSAPSRKKNEASPSKASTKHKAACIRFGNVAAASAAANVNTEMRMNAMLFIERSLQSEREKLGGYRCSHEKRRSGAALHNVAASSALHLRLRFAVRRCSGAFERSRLISSFSETVN